jgi:ABC-type maltose transport system permease subunit
MYVYAAVYPLICVAVIYALWVLFLAVMSLDRAKRAGTLRPIAFALGIPLLAIGLFIDFLSNVFIMTFVLLELPREWTVTARLRRHIKGSGWKRSVALYICGTFLDYFDPNPQGHCGD